MSVTAAKGFVAAGVAAGIKASGDLDLSLVATADGRPVRGRGRLHRQQDDRGAGAHLATPTSPATGGRAAAVVLNAGNANAATGARAGPTPRPCAPPRRPSSGCATERGPRLLHRPDRHPAADRRDPGGHPRRGGRPLGRRRRADGGRGDPHHRHPPQGGRRCRWAGRGRRGRHGQGGGHARPNMATMLAVLTTDAEAEPDDCAAMLRAGGRHQLQRLDDRRLPLHQRHRHRPGQRRGRAGRPATTWPRPSAEACARPGRSRWPGTPRAPPRSCGSRSTGAATDDDAEAGARQIARSAPVQVLLVRAGPVLGTAGQRAGQRRHRLRPGAGVGRPTAASWWPPAG